ncbi:MAG: type VII secretion protein EccC, partial [Mycobacteriaceae bacterium]|nr:type VII secretion protein EccC [Mycobacteriaceae bacterium]
MDQIERTAATTCFVLPRRQPSPLFATGETAVAAPPEPARLVRSSRWIRLVPMAMAAMALGITVVAWRSGAVLAHNPSSLLFPIMMLVSTFVTVAAGRDRNGAADITGDRIEYLGYLGRLRRSVTETALAQRYALEWCDPCPDSLWTLIGGPRMWERGPADADFCCVRIGLGSQPLSTPLVAPELG